MIGLIVLAASLALGLSGCGTLDPGGPYQGDKFLYNADGVISSSYELLHAFVTWEAKERANLTGTPEVTTYADYVRANAKGWVQSAIAVRDAYAADPGKDPVDLQRALAVLRESAAQAAKYLLAASGGGLVTPAP